MVIAGLLPILSANLRRPWSATVTATDASEGGQGIVQRQLDLEAVASMGRWGEKWRFRRLPPHEWQPRSRGLATHLHGGSLAAADIANVDHIMSWDDLLRPTEQAVKYLDEALGEWSLRVGFPEVPAAVVQGHWQWVHASPFHFRESIPHLEGRALLNAVRRRAKDIANHDSRIVMLCDNFGLVMSIEKGRASDYGILQICRRVGALCLAAGITLHVRWVPSEVNPGDPPSRIFNHLLKPKKERPFARRFSADGRSRCKMAGPPNWRAGLSEARSCLSFGGATSGATGVCSAERSALLGLRLSSKAPPVSGGGSLESSGVKFLSAVRAGAGLGTTRSSANCGQAKPRVSPGARPSNQAGTPAQTRSSTACSPSSRDSWPTDSLRGQVPGEEVSRSVPLCPSGVHRVGEATSCSGSGEHSSARDQHDPVPESSAHRRATFKRWLQVRRSGATQVARAGRSHEGHPAPGPSLPSGLHESQASTLSVAASVGVPVWLGHGADPPGLCARGSPTAGDVCLLPSSQRGFWSPPPGLELPSCNNRWTPAPHVDAGIVGDWSPYQNKGVRRQRAPRSPDVVGPAGGSALPRPIASRESVLSHPPTDGGRFQKGDRAVGVPAKFVPGSARRRQRRRACAAKGSARGDGSRALGHGGQREALLQGVPSAEVPRPAVACCPTVLPICRAAPARSSSRADQTPSTASVNAVSSRLSAPRCSPRAVRRGARRLSAPRCSPRCFPGGSPPISASKVRARSLGHEVRHPAAAILSGIGGAAGSGYGQRHLSGASRTRFLELFAGTCRLSQTAADCGIQAESWEIARSQHEDIMTTVNTASLYARLRAGSFCGIWLGVTCGSWTTARRGNPDYSGWPPPLRSPEYIWGLPNLSPADVLRVKAGNRTACWAARFFAAAAKLGVPVCIENPAGSRLWQCPPFKTLISKHKLWIVHQCQFGVPWRKATCLLTANWDLTDVALRCSGKVCSHTGQAHVQLSGSSKGGFLTAAASPYPGPFCTAVINALQQECRDQRLNRLTTLVT
ncbi:unnamed protein product [Polarella glacialis]|uniref:Uncharacterized protein n=1 Tax=Polarella glacialis TaxID=89957 RepID=A0A813LSZ3_POLGL|nr:unnamed protein product [Polarella glacialis]